MLLELVTGKKPVLPEFGDNTDIVKWVCTKISSNEGVMEVLDSRLADSSKNDMLLVLRVALLCTNALPLNRPSMRQVVEMLVEANPQLRCKSSSGKKNNNADPLRLARLLHLLYVEFNRIDFQMATLGSLVA